MVLLDQLHSRVFIIINYFEGHYWNIGLPTLNILGGFVFLFINYYSFVQKARIILSMLSTASVCSSTIKFQNGNEYYLIANMVAARLILKSTSAIV